jgi:hypothetical protein
VENKHRDPRYIMGEKKGNHAVTVFAGAVPKPT